MFSFFFIIVSIVGGRASAQRISKNIKFTPESDDATYTVQVNGFGFATFCHFTAFALCLVASYLISPYFKGSPKEVQLLHRPKEVDHGDHHHA